MYREALHLLETGVADAETIDRSFRNACGLWATLCGPFRWIDISGGPQLYSRVMRGILPTLCDETEPLAPIRKLEEAEALGIVNGRGFYSYSSEEARRWEELYREHAWTVRKLLDKYFPLEDGRGQDF
jgi:3-hydroxybutyryl-CoA dehydrogenase